MARLSTSPTSSGGSPSARTPGGDGGNVNGGESDVFDEVDDTEMQLQNTISHIERLILSSRKVKTLAPSAAASSAAAREAGGGPSDSSGGEGDGKSGGGGVSAESDGDGAEAPGSKGARARVPPKIDRKALLSRRQSTSFFDTKPVFSARDSSSSFTKMWNGGGGTGGGSALGALGEESGKRPLTSRAAHSRRQSERWGWRGDDKDEDVVVGTPPTAEGSAGSTSESPSNG